MATPCNFLSFPPSIPLPIKNPPPKSLSLSTHLSLPLPSFPTLSCSHDNRLLPVTETKASFYDFVSAAYPSLAYANTLFFKSGYNVQVVVGDDEPEEVLLRRFRREVFKAGVIQECKRRRWFETKQEERKRRTRDAARRNRRRRTPPKTKPADKQETLKKENHDDEEDNWELPEEVELPYCK